MVSWEGAGQMGIHSLLDLALLSYLLRLSFRSEELIIHVHESEHKLWPP